MSFYWVWIPAVTLLYCVSAFWTVWANDKENPNSWKWVIALYVLGLCGLWPLVARFSHNLVLDALLYDLIIFFAFYLTLLYLGEASKFTLMQWVGSILVVLGFLMLKVTGR